ncbi:MAG: hypothetical protein ACXADY_06745 [Candidatus Hodarchaeales archaeon]|jgi:poly [ADP-ribose] polymerase
MPAKLDDKPIIEFSKSGRASCRTCRRKIVKEEIRIGIPYTFTKPDGETITSYGYYHPLCAPRDKIETILEIVASSSTIDSENRSYITESLKKRQKEGTKSPQSRNAAMAKPFLEPSKSSRGACRTCEKKIEKGIYRVAEPSQVELDDGRKFFSHKFYHVQCYLESASEPKSVFQGLLQASLQRKSVSKTEIDSLEKEYKDYFLGDETAAEVLLLITEEPLELETLKKVAKEKGVPFSVVEKAIEQGLLKGIFFKPSESTIQKL